MVKHRIVFGVLHERLLELVLATLLLNLSINHDIDSAATSHASHRVKESTGNLFLRNLTDMMRSPDIYRAA